jgi:hypothetical protein
MMKFNSTGRPKDYGFLPKKEAIAAGHNIYKGQPCKHGHEGVRYMNGNCIKCKARKTIYKDNIQSKMLDIDHLKDKEPDYWDDM